MDIMAANPAGWGADKNHLACGRPLTNGSQRDGSHLFTVSSCVFGARGKEMTANLMSLVSTGEDHVDTV